MDLTDPYYQRIAIAVGSAVGVVLVVFLVHLSTRPAFFSFKDKVVFITGGSSGIGKSIAAECLKKGAHVALFARKPNMLEAAKQELLLIRTNPSQRVTAHSVDVTDDAAVHTAVAAAAAAHGGVLHAVVCSAGTSQPREFVDTTAQDFTQLLALNITGCRNAVHASLPFMSSPSGARVVLISSQAGQASKFGLAGFAQSLSMELYPRNILVSLSFPPDTDTPLLAEENLQKPAITRMLSEATTTVKPEVVAKDVLAGMERWSPVIPVGFDGWMLSTVTAGMGPAGNLLDAIVQVTTMGLWRAIGLLYVQSFYSTVKSVSASTPRAKPQGKPEHEERKSK